MFRRKSTPAPSADPRAALIADLAQAGEVIASACGTCGATVRVNDPEAVQTWNEVGRYPYARKVRSWRYHGTCSRATSGPALVALLLDPDACPVRVTQAHADAARTLGAPLLYAELEDSAPEDSGRFRSMFQHVKRIERDELRAFVERRHTELTVPVPHPSGWPCGICGTSHELTDRWDQHNGRPVCGGCSQLIQRAKIPGNQRLEEYARSAAWDLIPSRRVIDPFPLARDTASYRELGPEERREPWAYVADLPEVPPTPEERLAELEKLAGVAA